MRSRIFAFLKRAATHNVELKVLSVVLAAVCWVAINDAISYERVVTDVPISVAAAEGDAVLFQSKSWGKVTVRGARTDVMSMQPEDLRIQVPLKRGGETQSGRVELSARDVRGGPRVRVTRVYPDFVEIRLTGEATKTVPVVVRYVGSPSGGLVKNVVCSPDKVQISGPSQELQSVEQVQTELIDIEGRSRSLTDTVRIVMPSDQWEARFLPPEVTVTVEIEQMTLTRHWDRVPVTPIGLDPKASVQLRPATVRLSLTGRPDVVSSLRDEDVRVWVDCANLSPAATNSLEAMVYVPPHVEAKVTVEPAIVNLLRRVEPEGVAPSGGPEEE